MSTRITSSNIARLVMGVACVLTASGCGGDLLRTGRSPVYLTVDGMQIQNGATQTSGSNLLSDVLTLVTQTINGQQVRVPTIFNDVATATLRVVAKNPTIETTDINAVTINRYRIRFRRADGRNTPGVDVPFGWDGGISLTIPAGTSGTAVFEIVRHASKDEPPLKNLVNNGGQIYIYTIAEITFFGRDQNGNEVTATTEVDVAFSDFGDPS
jgi:hypothetical protein